MKLSQERQAGATTGAALPEVRFKDLDNTKRELGELFKCWNNRLTWPVHISEKYVGGTLSIIIKFKGVPRRDISNIEVISAPSDELVSATSHENRVIGAKNPEIRVSGSPDDWRDDCVFVRIVQLVEGISP